MNLSREGLKSPNAPARTTSHVRGGTKSHHTTPNHTTRVRINDIQQSPNITPIPPQQPRNEYILLSLNII
jgi:hypothetical protein